MINLPKLRREIAHRVHSTRPREFALLMKWLDLQPGEQVCDVGCGDGFWTSRLAGAGRHIWGVDLDPSAVARAQRYYGAAAAFLAAEGSALPLADGEMDAVTSLCALQHFPDDAQGLREFGRVLRRAGRLAMSLDSLSLPWMREDYKALQARRYHVLRLYTHGSLGSQLDANGFTLRRYAYVGTSRLTSALIQLQVQRGWQVNYLAPLALPLSMFADANARGQDQGYSLVVLAEKVSS